VPLKDARLVVDLEALISLAPGQTDALDRFVSTCLADAGLWESPRTSDGVSEIVRVVETSRDRLRVCGRIWSIDQVRHTFWLELQREAAGDEMTWFLYFDVAESSPRRTRNALDDHDRPEDIHWFATLAGEATILDSVLLPVPGSTRLIVHDTP
jgi:hypothetical protein